MIDKIRPRKLNATADSRLRKADEMQDALNLVSSNDFRATGDTTEGNDGTGNAGVLKPTRGNTPIPFPESFTATTENRRVLGSVTDHAHNVVYFFVWNKSGDQQGVYAYDPDSYLPGATPDQEQCVSVFKNKLFNFPSNGFIKADLVHINKPFSHGEREYDSQPVLYFTDNKNEPRKLHPFRALTEGFSEYKDVDINDFITACPKTPVKPIEVRFERDIDDETSAFEGLPGFQFAYQHIYKSGEESALSTFSDIAIPQAYYNQGSSSTADLYANNKCVLTIPSLENYDNNEVQKFRTLEVTEVRILRRIGNNGTWAVIDEVTVEELEANSNEYNFYNRSIFSGFSAQTAIKPYDNLPQIAEAQSIVSDRLTYGNYVEGYDNVKVTASATVEYHERPDDFTELEVEIIPTVKFSEDSSAYIPNKRAGYYIDTSNFPSTIEEGSTIQLDFSVKPNRNFHIYNSNNSFHGSRHLTVEDVDDEFHNTVRGDEADDGGVSRVAGLNANLDQMFGVNDGVSIPGLTWQCTDSQDTSATGEHEVVFGTSAANPFILKGNSLHFSVKIKIKHDAQQGQAFLQQIFENLLSGEELTPNQLSFVEVLSQNNIARYHIDEGLDGGDAFTSPEDAILPVHEIPVAAGGDDRKHLIVALAKKSNIENTSVANELKHQSPCGYFIVNKAQVGFGLNKLGGGYLELDLRELNEIEALTAIPFINAERWKDEAFEHGPDGNNAYEANNDNRNWGIRDATLWSMDSLIIDSWFCYSKTYLQSAIFNPKVFTPNPLDFPRYMNGSDTGETGLSFGSLNEEVEGGGKGKNAAIVNIDDFSTMNAKFIGDTANGGNINSYYRMRWNAVGTEFKQSVYMPYLQAITIKDGAKMRTGWLTGRNLIVGYLNTNAGPLIDLSGSPSFSILDGATGPGGSVDGGENIRKVKGDGTNYAVGSITGEMVFAGRIAARGFIRPEQFKRGARQAVLGNGGIGWDEWFHQYGLGPALPYFGGVGYQRKFEMGSFLGGMDIIDLFSAADVGFINNWLYTGGDTPSGDDETSAAAMVDYGYGIFYSPNTPGVFVDLGAKYMGTDTWIGEDDQHWEIADLEGDLNASATIGDAPILLTGREFGIFGGTDWAAGGRSFKTRASHSFGIVYYDERGRSGKVNPLLFKGSEGTLPSPGVYVKGYSPSERSNKGRASIEIDLTGQTPPEWAFNYQIVYGGNTNKGNFIQYSTGGAFIANKGVNEVGEEEAEDPSSTNIYVSLNYLQGNKDVSYAEAFGAVSPLGIKQLYTYAPGDKLRVLSYYTSPTARTWVENIEFEIAGVETVTNNPEGNIFRRAFELEEDNNIVADCRTGQFLVLKNNTKAEGFNYTSVKAAENESQTTSHHWNDRCVVEIYSPLKEADTEDILFYETGEVYSISKNDEGNLVHYPEKVTLNKGDVWFRPVALATAEWGDEQQDEDGNSLDSYLKFKNLIRRGIGEGESTPRFKNYFVEAMTFNDTFAGNNVIGIGKPNNVDAEVIQTRKPSSVIYSDKHNFAKKGLKFTSFNGTASNWKDLPREHGAINYLLNNYDSLTCIQENKSSNIPVERNIISDASGANTLITSNKVIGVQAFYAGEYGCDNNPESVVKTDAAVYFASKAKSEVYRLTSQGVQVISKEGMASYFFRLFEEAKNSDGKVYIPGGYDPLKDEFLITITNLGKITTTEYSLTQGSWGEYTEPETGIGDDENVIIYGCTAPSAINYNPDATDDDGSCYYGPNDDDDNQ